MRSIGFLLGVLLSIGVTLAAQQHTTSSQAAQGTVAAGATQQSPPAGQSGNGVSAAAASAPQDGNGVLQSRIEDALRNEPTLGASHLTATVTDSGVDLSGTVGSTKDKQTAERIASSFDGNRQLHDNIVVTGAGHSDLAPNHPAMNNGGVGTAPNPR